MPSPKKWSGVLGRRSAWSAGFGILVGLGCLGLLFRQVDIKQSFAALGRLNGPYLLIPLAVLLVNLPMRALRWQLIFPASRRPSLGTCLTVLGIGNMANFLLPGRAGDLTRCIMVGAETSLDETSCALATLTFEKLLDGLALIGMVLFSIWALHPPQWVFQALRFAVAIFGGALVLLVFLRYRIRLLIDLVRRAFDQVHLSSLEGKFDGLLTSFADGLGAIDSPRRVLILLLLTAAIWTTEAGSAWGLAKALDLAVSFRSALVASAILGLGLMIPAAPGGLGTYELFGTEAFRLAGLSSASALTLTVVLHAWVFLANVGLGILLLAAKGISLASLRRQLEANPASKAAIQPPN